MGLGSNPKLGGKGKKRGEYRANLDGDGDVSLTMDGALQLVMEFWRDHVADHPDHQRPKFSLAWLADHEWCASLTDWSCRRGVSEFGGSPKRAVEKLAERLCLKDDPWRPLKDKA